MTFRAYHYNFDRLVSLINIYWISLFFLFILWVHSFSSKQSILKLFRYLHVQKNWCIKNQMWVHYTCIHVTKSMIWCIVKHHNYVNTRLFYVNMQHYYVDIQHNYVNAIWLLYVNMRLELCCMWKLFDIMHVDIIYLETMPPCNKTELSVQCIYFEYKIATCMSRKQCIALNISCKALKMQQN